jgi:hypothetical protein
VQVLRNQIKDLKEEIKGGKPSIQQVLIGDEKSQKHIEDL